jgi:hypothetical protein
MAITEDLRRLLGFDDGPENNAEIQFKIKPLGAVGAAAAAASDPTVTGASGETGAGGGSPATGLPGTGLTPAQGTPQAGPLGFGPQGASIVPQAQQLRKTNPTLITHPLGAQTDDIYEAAVAQLQFDTQSRYAQLLQELGFMDDSGQFMPGTLETDAARQRNELDRQRSLGIQDVTENAVRGGTVFSGRRAQLQAQTQQPFDSAIAELQTRLSRELANRFQGIGGLTQQFELGRNSLIADAAERIKAGLMTGPVGGEGGGGGGGAPAGGALATARALGAGPRSGDAGLQSSTSVSPETLNSMPPGSRVIYNPQVGYYVVDAQGRRIGHIDPATGRFVNTAIPTGGGGGMASKTQ